MVRTHHPAIAAAPVLPAPTQNLHSGGDLRSVPYRRTANYGIASYVYLAADRSLRVRQERAETNAAVRAKFRESESVIGGPEILAREAGQKSQKLRPKMKATFKAAEARR
jgi:hypothetical protein